MNQTRAIIARRLGMTIIEVVMAIVILSIALPPMAASFADASRQSIRPSNSTVASFLAINRIGWKKLSPVGIAAVNIYRDVLRIAPNDPDCYANLGTSFIKMYHREKSPTWKRMAKEAWEQSLVLNPAQPRIREYLESCQSDQ